MEEFCSDCSAPRGPGEFCCQVCGCDVYTTALPGALVNQVATRPSSSAEVFGFLKGHLWIEPGTVALLAGPPGVGKTTLALELFAMPWWATSEMGVRQVAGYASRVRASLAGIGLVVEGHDADGEPWAWFDELEQLAEHSEHPPDLVVDSVSACRNARAVLEAARAYAQHYNARVCLVAHFTADNKIKGGTELPHLVDHVIRMTPEGNNRRVRVAKSRSGPDWSGLYELGNAGVRKATRTGFYSVEGPPYRLERHPSRRNQYAGVLKAAESDEALRGRLGHPPVAVAALASELYPGGWTEPDDYEARAAFAVSEGVRYFSPLASDPLYDDPELEDQNHQRERAAHGQTA